MKINGTRWVGIVLTALLPILLMGSVAMAADAEIEDMQGALIVACCPYREEFRVK